MHSPHCFLNPASAKVTQDSSLQISICEFTRFQTVLFTRKANTHAISHQIWIINLDSRILFVHNFVFLRFEKRKNENLNATSKTKHKIHLANCKTANCWNRNSAFYMCLRRLSYNFARLILYHVVSNAIQSGSKQWVIRWLSVRNQTSNLLTNFGFNKSTTLKVWSYWMSLGVINQLTTEGGEAPTCTIWHMDMSQKVKYLFVYDTTQVASGCSSRTSWTKDDEKN